ncbi:MAG: phage head spike fiber domain-containing protein, partial [Plesiomonas shigelloides]
ASSASFATTEANRSRTEADRSKSEADRAKQISGLETVSDAVALAALPLPDVWAPLTDSLRLFTGYGREVKVGEDVVARMVNFSRSTTKAYQGKDGLQKTVAINEAAFGSGGCLVDGQSANVVPFYDNFSSYMSKPTVTTPESDGFTVFDLDQIAYTGSASSLTVGAIYTISALVDVSGPCVIRIGFGGQNREVTISAAMRGVISLSANCESNAGSLCRIGPTSRNAGVRVRVRYLQLEALPFASSPIPTSGAAVTRAADAIQIPYAGNGVPLSDMQMTMSAVIKANPRPGEPTALIDALDITPNVGVFLSATGLISTRIFDVQWDPGITPDMTKEQVVALSFNGATGAVAMRVGDKVVTGTVVVPKGISRSAGNIGLLCRSGTNTRTGFGSVRDFKIWHKFFTVDQLKAIK